MIPSPDLDLLQDYLDGRLADADALVLQARLKADPELAEQLILLAREESLLNEWGQAMAVADSVEREAILPPVKPKRRRVGALAAAACLLALLGAGLYALVIQPGGEDTREAAHALLEEVQGDVLVNGEEAEVGRELHPGDEVRTSGERGFAVVRYPDDTRLTLGADSLLRLQQEEEEGKRLYLAEGCVHAEVAKQPADRPLVLATPHASIRVLGTRFSSSTVARGTRIELEEGRIQVESAGKTMNVEGGRYVVDVPVPQPPPVQLLVPQKLPTPIGKPRVTLPRGDGPVPSICFAPAGDWLAVASNLGNIDVWDTTQGTLLQSWPAHARRARTLAWTPDRLLASGGDDRTAKVWDAASGKLLHLLPKVEPKALFRSPVECVSFTPDGSLLAVAASLRPNKPAIVADITLWDPRAGAFRGRLAGHTGTINCVVFSPDGKTLASGGKDGTVRLWDRETLTETACLDCAEPVLSLAWSPDGKTLAAGSRDRVIRFWDAEARHLRTILEAHPRDVRSLSWSPDGRYLASAGGDPTVRVWEPATGRPVALFQGHSYQVSRVQFSPDGLTLASAGWDRHVKLWDFVP